MEKSFLIWGDDGVAEHVIASLHASGKKLIVFSESKKDRIGRAAARVGAKHIAGSPLDSDDLARADLTNVAAIALLVDNDMDVIAAGMKLAEEAPHLPLLMRMFEIEIANSISRLTNATVLSASEIAAPVIADMAIDPTDVEISAHQARILLTGSALPRLTRSFLRTAAGVGILFTVLIVNVCVDHFTLNMSWIDAAVATARMCFGDLPIDNAPDGIKILSVATIVTGAFSVLLFFSAAQHRLASRLSAERTIPMPGRNHVIIFGGGKAGRRTAELLQRMEIPMVMVDTDASCHAASFCRINEIAFRVGSAIDSEFMKGLNIKSARAVLALTDNDTANIASALHARAIRPDVRVVVRTFEASVAEHLDTEVNIHRALSVSGIAAPEFTSKLLAIGVS